MEAPQPQSGSSNPPSGPSNGRGTGRRRHRPSRAPQAAAITETNSESQPSNNESSRGLPNRSRGNNSRGRANHRGGPSSSAPRETPSIAPSHPPATRGRGRGGRARFGSLPSAIPGRQFVGGLSRDVDSETQSVVPDAPTNTDLNINAAVFTPGSSSFTPSSSHSHKHPRPARGKKIRKGSVSNAADLSTRIHEDIDNNCYECAVCTDEISRRARVWSCRTCWTVFHLKCIQKWAKSKKDTTNQAEQIDQSVWRCPGCNLQQDIMPDRFTCWCEKEIDPPSLSGIPPFSCGQTCSRPRACPHSCSSFCHAGPCPPCDAMGPSQTCFCGRDSKTRRCLDTDYKNGWSCGSVCNELMPCGEHYCGRPCHEGLCGACEVPIEAKCYCGQEEKEIPCCDRSDEKESRKATKGSDGNSTVEDWTGIFDCGNLCDRQFDCGKHRCQKPCHQQDELTAHCPRAPDVVSNCPCGKTPLEEISSDPRKTCEDNIPSCHKACLKNLACGHACQQICHTGECAPCVEQVDLPCRCGRASFKTMCFQRHEMQPMCTRVCHVNLNCGRHECGERCCPGERKAAERLATKKKLRSIQSIDSPASGPEVEAEHICTRVCGRPLKCGSHNCQELCHRGICSSCREAIFEDISCHCGMTVLQAPLPCGTQPPPCRYQCRRASPCGHPVVPHNCHLDNESCPKCPYHVTKPCLCGKQQLKNQPCSATEIRCGEICGQKLKCGFHTCRKSCHRPGECEDLLSACPHLCGKEKSCGHPCSDACHSPFVCKEDKPCQHKTFITCSCQRIKQEIKCVATKTTPGNTSKTLTCDEECLRLERNRKLQLALNIDPTTHTDDHVPYSPATLAAYRSLDLTWIVSQENALRTFAADPDAKRYRFKPMKRNQRAFIHLLAEDFGFDSESMDPEPHRHVALFKTPRFVSAPMKTLADCIRIRQRQAVETGHVISSAAVGSSASADSDANALNLTDLKFGLTEDELRSALSQALPNVMFSITFLPNDSVILFPTPIHSISGNSTSVPTLLTIKQSVARALASPEHIATVSLCRFDVSTGETHARDDITGAVGAGSSAGGWSKVAAKAAAQPRRIPVQIPVISKSSFVVLGSGVIKKKMKERVVEDWEEEEERLEKEEEEKGKSMEVERDDNSN